MKIGNLDWRIEAELKHRGTIQARTVERLFGVSPARAREALDALVALGHATRERRDTGRGRPYVWRRTPQ